MNDIEKMLAKQFLLRVRQEGYSLVENPPRSLDGINIDIYRGETKICTFDDRQLGEGRYISLRVTTYDSTREEIKHDYNKLFYMYTNLRDLYLIYDKSEPLQGYDQSLGFREIMQYNGCTLAVKAYSNIGELEFATFITGRKSHSNSKTILHTTYFDMDGYPLARLDFVSRSGLLTKEQLITPDNIKYLHGSCSKTMVREGSLFDEDTKAALGQVINDLEKTQASFWDIKYNTEPIPAQNASYIETKVFSAKGIFTKQQIDRATVPNGLFAYDIQYSRSVHLPTANAAPLARLDFFPVHDELKPELIWKSAIGRRFGTVITKKQLPIGEKGYTELKEKDFSLNPNNRRTLKEFQSKSRESAR